MTAFENDQLRIDSKLLSGRLDWFSPPLNNLAVTEAMNRNHAEMTGASPRIRHWMATESCTLAIRMDEFVQVRQQNLSNAAHGFNGVALTVSDTSLGCFSAVHWQYHEATVGHLPTDSLWRGLCCIMVLVDW